jgi:hypothetical protein
VVAVWQVASTITERTSTNTIRATSAKLECGTFTRHKISSGSQPSISRRSVETKKVTCRKKINNLSQSINFNAEKFVADTYHATSFGLLSPSKLAKPTSPRRIPIPLLSLISSLLDTQKCLERAEYQRYQLSSGRDILASWRRRRLPRLEAFAS